EILILLGMPQTAWRRRRGIILVLRERRAGAIFRKPNRPAGLPRVSGIEPPPNIVVGAAAVPAHVAVESDEVGNQADLGGWTLIARAGCFARRIFLMGQLVERHDD